MLAIPIMVTSSSGGLETIITLGIRNVGGDDIIADYEVTRDGVIVANVKGFERDRGPIALLGEAIAAWQARTDSGDITLIRRERKDYT